MSKAEDATKRHREHYERTTSEEDRAQREHALRAAQGDGQREWVVRTEEGDDRIYVAEGPYIIAENIWASRPSDSNEYRYANARLIAAAPALYAALEATSCRYSRRKVCSSNVVDMCDRCAALALANGQDTSDESGSVQDSEA